MRFRGALLFCFPLLWIAGSSAPVFDVRQLVQKIYTLQGIHYILLLGNVSGINWPGLLWQQPVPVIQLNKLASYALYAKHSKNLLAIVDLEHDPMEEKGLLRSLLVDLNQMISGHILFLLGHEKQLLPIFSWCWKHHLMNVLAILPEFESNGLVHSYTPFPEMQLQQQQIDDLDLISAVVGDMKGYRLPVVIGSSSPRFIGYRNARGDFVYGGPVGHLLTAFEQRYKCIFVQPLPLNISFIPPAQALKRAVLNGTVEISWGATYPDIPLIGYTYPYDLINWCLMMPVDAEVTPSEFYVRVFDLGAFLLTVSTMVLLSMVLSTTLLRFGYGVHIYEFFLHDSCLRGALGQSFIEAKQAPWILRSIYLQLCILGILLTSWYNAYYSSYVTSPPKEPPFRSFEDVLRSGIKVVAWTPEYNELAVRAEPMKKYESMFKLEPDFRTFLELRDSFNTKYGYVMTTTKWAIINEHQKVFSNPLFALREDLCFYHAIPIVFPIRKNSVFKEPLERLILDVIDTGLLQYWRRIAFNELIEARMLKMIDLSPHKEFRPMHTEDLKDIYLACAFIYTMSALLFLLELVWYWRRRCFRWLNENLSYYFYYT